MTYFSLPAALLLFQAGSNGAATPPPTDTGAGLIEMITHSGPTAFVVLVILLVASLWSWAIIFSKNSTLKKANQQSRRFLRAFRKAGRLQEIAAVSEQFKPSPLVTVFDDVYEAYRRQTGGYGPPTNLTALERSAQSAASESLTILEQRMTWLATIGSVAPFVGLFGTVMGIIDAFHGLGTAGAATLRAVAPGVSEALITTAAGLVVAVPAVVAYNQFSARIREVAARLDDFTRELMNSMEEAGQPSEPAEAGRGLHK
ncbi:MAG: MotA/TolQ/ExbB proton channel family protein [Acidobacteria bacterium]|nr:MotA/TolQ/ExbB proton channel family protein [Acidobacteriota bacterium]